MSIFRQEVLEARKDSYGLGTVRAPFPRSFRLLIILSSALAAALLICVLSFPYGRGVNAEGFIIERGANDALARVLVDGGAVSQVHSGMEALVQFPAFPAGDTDQINGAVVEVSRVPIAQMSDGRYSVDIIVPLLSEGVRGDVAPGVVVQVRLTLKKQRIYQWIFQRVRK